MIDRRDFIKILSGLVTGLHLPVFGKNTDVQRISDKFGDTLPVRILGNTGARVTMLGVGGSHIGWMSERDAEETIEVAIEGGVRFFDNVAMLKEKIELAKSSRSINEDERQTLIEKVADIAVTGKFEDYKYGDM